MRSSRIAILLSALALAFLLPLHAVARIVTIIITGTVASGTDSTGVFGPAGTDLAHKPFTLVFTFDDSKGKQTLQPCTRIPVCYSQIIPTDTSSPGIASLQIGDSSPYMIGTASDGSAKSQAIKHIWPNTYDIVFEVGDRNGAVSGRITNTASRPPATNPDWRSAFVDKTLSKTHTIISGVPIIRFNILNRDTRTTASGVLTPATICVGDASNGCSYSSPKISIASNAAQNPATGSSPQAATTPTHTPPALKPTLVPTPFPSPTPAPEVGYKQALLTGTMAKSSDLPKEVATNSCVIESSTSHPGLRMMPLRVALDYLTSKNLFLITAPDGTWSPITRTFSADPNFPNLYSIPLTAAQSTFNLDLSSQGILTISEAGSSDSLVAGSGMSHLTGREKWSASEKVDLKSGSDTLTFSANLDAHYIGGSQQEPGKPVNCTIHSQYSGEYDATDMFTLVVPASPSCPATYLSVAAGNVYVARPEKLAELPRADFWNLFRAMFNRSPAGVLLAGLFTPSQIADDELEDALTHCLPITQPKDDLSRCRNSNHPDLFRSGNAQGPRLDNVRPKDITLTSSGLLSTQSGISSFASIKDKGVWWLFPSTALAPLGICLVNDEGDHWLWEPATEMPLTTYINILQSTKPNWSRAQ